MRCSSQDIESQYVPEVERLGHEREDVGNVGVALLRIRSVRGGVALSDMTAIGKIHE